MWGGKGVGGSSPTLCLWESYCSNTLGSEEGRWGGGQALHYACGKVTAALP